MAVEKSCPKELLPTTAGDRRGWSGYHPVRSSSPDCVALTTERPVFCSAAVDSFPGGKRSTPPKHPNAAKVTSTPQHAPSCFHADAKTFRLSMRSSGHVYATAIHRTSVKFNFYWIYEVQTRAKPK